MVGAQKGVPRGPKKDPIFGSVLGSLLEPKMGPKIVKKRSQKLVDFWKCFSRGFGALELPFGSLEGPLEAVLGGLWTPKTLKNIMFFKVFHKSMF